MKGVNGVILLLSVSSYWQVASGYVDVFSHRFIFKTVDPTLNPAHVSLYAASLLGFCMVYLGLRGRDDSVGNHIARPGLLVAFVGVSGEIISGALNELYHRFFVNTSVLTPTHFLIHGLFVVSMFLVALGGLVSSALLYTFRTNGVDQRYVKTSFVILFSSVWMLLLGSASYLATSVTSGGGGGDYLLIGGSFFASSVAVSALVLTRRLGYVTVAALSFFIFNACLLYGFERNLYLLPLPVLSAAAGEILAGRLSTLGETAFSAVSGVVFSGLSYWLLYPYSYAFFGFSNIPTPYLDFFPVIMILGSGAAGGMVALLTIKGTANMLSPKRQNPRVRLNSPLQKPVR